MNRDRPDPAGGVDYPRTLLEFDRWFGSEEACVAYLLSVRWPGGFRCPGCGGSKAWTTARGLLRCAQCHRQTSPVAGTIFEGTRKPLRTWFLAMWSVTSQKAGGSALGLQRVLGIGSYQTAWSWLHKLRHAMVRPGRERLSGSIEIDETYVGGVEPGVRGRKTVKKAIVVVAAEKDGNGIGRIRLGRVRDVSAASLLPFVSATVQLGAEIHTDGWAAYAGLRDLGYLHVVSNLKRSGHLAHELLPRVHRVASLLTRWILGTHQGALGTKHLDYYLDEFTFRFNRRKSKARGLLFYRLLQQATNSRPVTYRDLVGRAEPTTTGSG